MAKTKRNIYTIEFKEEAVKLVTEHGYSIREAASRLGISESAVCKWKNALSKGKDAKVAFPGKGHLKPEDVAFKELQKEVERLRRERDILKKAILSSNDHCNILLNSVNIGGVLDGFKRTFQRFFN